ncbi:RBBP9/YdeN family alpha/beta hydrolase [Kitasatospora sp. NPDC088346]|uniref:RBBP9/YdeN family alpha/beta hydrolase n=1 Tax=Kitasatospora sp. NPDC088346 TaxID=3364073 RepID=UPI00382BAD99
MTAPVVLVLPGFQDSGPEHWQSHWVREDPATFRRVEQADWDRPRLRDWVTALDDAVTAAATPAGGPVLLAAHSLGCITITHWAAGAPAAARAVTGALLVAPADVDTAEVPELVGFRPIPLRPLPFPSTVVASSDDPWCSPGRARAFAAGWGSRHVELGPYGHLNADSGLGSWPEGRTLLAASGGHDAGHRARTP